MATRKQLEAALAAWGKVETFEEACDLMARCIDGKYVWAPPHYMPETDEDIAEMGQGFLEEDSLMEAGFLASINHGGILTIDSQAGAVEEGISHRNGKKYVIRQRAYVIGLMLRDRVRLNDLLKVMDHVDFRFVEGGSVKDPPVITEQNDKPVTTGRTQTVNQMVDYLGRTNVLSKKLLYDLRRNCQTVMFYDPMFGSPGLAAHIAMALRKV
jgi:hypothetical protein